MRTSILIISFSFFLYANLFAENVKIQANKVSLEKDSKTSIFEGDVVVNTQEKIIKSNYVKYDKAKDKNRKPPKVTNYIGECFLKIANHLSYRPNFINYTYRDDMISDGIENCLQYMNNFNPKKSNNPFAYFTQIIYYAFIRRIQKEKKQQDVKAKVIANSGVEMMMDSLEGDDAVYKSQMLDFLQKNIKESNPQEIKSKKK